MIKRIKNSLNLLSNMGMRYTVFRVKHELSRRSGLLRRRFPVNPRFSQYISLEDWKALDIPFFFESRESLQIPKQPVTELHEWFANYQKGKFLFFSSTFFDLGKDYDWITNPDSGYKYDISKHWTEIADFSKEAGDIKYVWEKSRFSFLYPLIRYDYHFNEDCSAQVFSEILSWIKHNPVNCGPNYRCSQEISLRVLNWTFALYYYKNSPILSKDVFKKIQFAIHWQMKHVYDNIKFSRIAVRNNHAITETLGLYIIGVLYPSLEGAQEWRKKGKQWFEEEIAYQVYEDGTYLQFSMNYHRVVVQLLTWAIVLAEKNGEKFQPVVYERARKSVEFLTTCMNENSGWLPNYGANDGALFFPLNNQHYRDYRPQLQALAAALKMDRGFGEIYEDVLWWGIEAVRKEFDPIKGLFRFEEGGYYIIREPETLTFIRCGTYKDRPSHADNLHVDIWYKDENILCDGGSYKYNTGSDTLRYFSGTASHNTVMIDDNDQMLKGGRFIWYYWSKKRTSVLEEQGNAFVFRGEIEAFRHLKQGISHRREIRKQKGVPLWSVTDTVENRPLNLLIKQLWHLPKDHRKVIISSQDEGSNKLEIHRFTGFVSTVYGEKKECESFYFATALNTLNTTIQLLED